MKRVNKKLFAALSLGFVALPMLTGCSSNEENVLILKALNCEDYIGEDAFEFTYETAEGEEVTVEYDDVISGFEAYEKAVYGRNVKVVYDTYDTNETMLSSLKTGKTSYDLIAASDYTIQKMMSLDMLQPIDRGNVPNYNTYCSPFLLEVMESITAPINGVEEKMSDYSVGYMWGTLGILFNPAKVEAETGVAEDTVKADMQSWDSLWDSKYRNQMSVKDSMRDTYSVGIMKQYGEEILSLMERSGCFDMEDGMLSLIPEKYDEALNTYNTALTEIFNRCDEKAVEEVKKVLLELKENVFGFEVDSGKDDMVKGLIGMNLAWSGDAVYSMDRGDNESGNTIYYSVPKTGGNIWFDSWSIPKTSDAEHKKVAEEFLNFISDPTVAAANMNTIGYTSFIAGETVHNLIREWFDPRAYSMFVYHDASGEEGYTWEDNDFIYEDYAVEHGLDEDVFTIVEGGDPAVAEDRVYEFEFSYDEETGYRYQDGKAYYRLINGEPELIDDDYGYFDMTGSTYDQAVVDGEPMTWEAYQALYNETILAEFQEEYGEDTETIDPLYEENSIEWSIRDLTYMFQGTIEEGNIDSESPDLNNLLFYTDEIEYVLDAEGNEVSVGRQFYAQYPDHTMIPKLAVMRDYGENNIFVLKMWSDVKSNNLPLAGVIVFGIILAIAAVAIIASIVTKHRYHAFRVERRKAIAAEVAAQKEAQEKLEAAEKKEAAERKKASEKEAHEQKKAAKKKKSE